MSYCCSIPEFKDIFRVNRGKALKPPCLIWVVMMEDLWSPCGYEVGTMKETKNGNGKYKELTV